MSEQNKLNELCTVIRSNLETYSYRYYESALRATS
jgi:hypothetical protein